MKLVWTHGILIYRKPLNRNRVLTEEKLDDIGPLIRKFSTKIFETINTTSGISLGSAWTATKLLHIRLYKITVVPENKPVDYLLTPWP
jgi:hypothetical protein